MSYLTALARDLWSLAAAHPRYAVGLSILAAVWLLIHSRPRLDSSYERRHPEAWRRRARQYAAHHGKWCRACVVWNVLALIPGVRVIVRWIVRRAIQLHHWRYPKTPGGELDWHLSFLCTDVWPDHHGDADKWRRFAESLPLVGRWAWAPVKVAFFATAIVCQLATLGAIVGGLWFGIPPAAQFVAQHVTFR